MLKVKAAALVYGTSIYPINGPQMHYLQGTVDAAIIESNKVLKDNNILHSRLVFEGAAITHMVEALGRVAAGAPGGGGRAHQLDSPYLILRETDLPEEDGRFTLKVSGNGYQFTLAWEDNDGDPTSGE